MQSSFPERLQGEISGLSRSVSNLGSSFVPAIAGTILVSDLASGNDSYVLAMIVLGVLALVGLAAGIRLPANLGQQGGPEQLAPACALETTPGRAYRTRTDDPFLPDGSALDRPVGLASRGKPSWLPSSTRGSGAAKPPRGSRRRWRLTIASEAWVRITVVRRV